MRAARVAPTRSAAVGRVPLLPCRRSCLGSLHPMQRRRRTWHCPNEVLGRRGMPLRLQARRNGQRSSTPGGRGPRQPACLELCKQDSHNPIPPHLARPAGVQSARERLLSPASPEAGSPAVPVRSIRLSHLCDINKTSVRTPHVVPVGPLDRGVLGVDGKMWSAAKGVGYTT